MSPTVAAPPIRRSLALLAALFVLSLPMVTTRLYASDEVQYFAYLRSLWFDHDLSFENEYQHFYDSGIVRYAGFHETFLERTTETGRRVNFGTVGSAVLWSPFYAVADVGVRVARRLGSDVAADGYSAPYVAAVAYGSAVYAWLSLACAVAIARRVLLGERGDAAWTARAGLVATLAIWIGTPLLFYMYIAPPMAHACEAFAVAAFVLAWLRVRERWSLRGLLLLGALAGVLGLVREQAVFAAIGPALDWAFALWRSARGGTVTAAAGSPRAPLMLVRNALAGAAAFVAVYAPQLAAYMVLNGYPGPTRLVTRKMNFAAPHAWGVLLSPEHGLLCWTPLVAPALAGLIWMALAARARGDADRARIALGALVIVASQVYIAGSVESWTVAGAFGQRRFVGLSALFVLGLAALIVRAREGWPRRALFAALALMVWWNLGLMAQFGTGLMDRQRLELGRNAYHTFVTIPRRLPELAWRYLFERRSFYRPATSIDPAPSPASPTPPSP